MSSPYLSTLHYYVRPRVSTWLGHMVSPYISTSHFFYCVTCCPPVCPCVAFHSSMCVFVVVTRGVNVAVFYSASCRLEVLTRVIFLLGHVSCLHLSISRWRIVHVSVSCWATHSFLVLLNVRFGPPRFRNLDFKCVHYMLTFI